MPGRRRGILALATVLALVAPSPPATAAPGHPEPKGEVGPCHPGSTILCGWVRVPRYRDRPGLGSPLTVRFVVHPHTDTTRAALEPVVGIEGGPGYGSIGSAAYFLFLLGPLQRRHDLILMDQRGTGESEAIDCPALQKGAPPYPVAAGRCAAQLGPNAGAYGSAAAADDLADVLDLLDVDRVDLYGDSYGSFLAQSFAIHHPERVRAMVLDGAYDDRFDPFERESGAALRETWRRLCARTPACGPGILRAISRVARHLSRRPLIGEGRDADGGLHRIRLDGSGLAALVFDATYYATVLRDLPAALVSYRAGDAAPLLRLAAEDLAGTAPGGSPSDYSMGDYAAVSCHDYPTAWDPAATLAGRRRQLAAAIDALAPSAFAPFRLRDWLASLYQEQLVAGCLRWPVPPVADPPFPPGPRGDIPVLVLNGEFDQATPVADAVRAARGWPGATFVEVANTLHITALADFQACASAIVRRFVITRSAGDVSCGSRVPPPSVTPAFPVRLADAPEAERVSGADRSTAADRRAAWVSAQTAGDALARWFWAMYGSTGHGLRGGTYEVSGPYLGYGPLVITFRGTRDVRDLAVSGELVWHRRRQRATARLSVSTPAGVAGAIRVAFRTDGRGSWARIDGSLDGRSILLRVPTPWVAPG